MKQLLTTAVLLLATMNAQAYPAKIKDDNPMWFGCSTQDQVSRATKMIIAEDTEAVATFIYENNCVLFHMYGVVDVEVEDTALLKGMVEIRLPGATKTLWTHMEAVESK